MSFPFAPRPDMGRGAIVAGICILGALTGCGSSSRHTTADSGIPSAVSGQVADVPTPPVSSTTALPPTRTPQAADSSTSPIPIDWSKPVPASLIISRIRARHPSAASARAAVQAAEARVVQARAWGDPDAAFTIGRTRGRAVGIEDDTPFGLAITQPLGAFGARRARTASALASAAAAESEAIAAMRELDRSAAQSLLRMITEDEALALTEAHLRIAENILSVSEKLVAAGEIGQADQARARAMLAQAQASRDAQARVRTTARAQVERWLGEALPDTPHVTGIWMEDDGNASEAIVTAEHPSLLAIQARVDAAARTLEAEQADRWPQWSIGIEANRDQDEDEVGLTFGFTIPVWNGNAGGVAVAQAERAQATADAAALRLRLEQETAEVRAALQQALSEYLTLTTAVLPAAQEALRLQQAAYAAGAADLPAVLESQRAVIDVQVQALESRQRAAEARLDLRVLLDGFDATQP